MKHNVFTIRLAPETAAQVTREAVRRGITRTSWAAHLIERGQAVESLERLIPEVLASPGSGSGGIPSQAIERVVFAACFSEAILKKLNASLNRSSSELGMIAAQARDQALAETAALMKPAE
jgi:hypothetical protein